ncbi:hypothetical protein [Actinokineospora sp. NBRC 105648]|uniref:hypothetical protein n=1 Tax=Actinokineospora sp. NBRC 105648 TaxID=3032206 RepID=UPI0024A02A52|nr:hypothetical protein [Actinokineospora sp. NBRC 105648]GLZ42500.1 hypothetical protein Acsp05_61240 [Actinokineospora sp. NBRC 105648]
MPEGTQPSTPIPPRTPADIREWVRAHPHDTESDGPWGSIFGNFLQGLEEAAAVAGATGFAISPDIRAAIVTQLTTVKDSVEQMSRATRQMSLDIPLGGGFAHEISRFNQDLAAGGPESAQELLTRFSQHIDELKAAVESNTTAYSHADDEHAGALRAIGGPE